MSEVLWGDPVRHFLGGLGHAPAAASFIRKLGAVKLALLYSLWLAGGG